MEVSRIRLGKIRIEEIQRREGNIRIEGMTDDELSQLFERYSRENEFDAFDAIYAEMVRREEGMQWLNSPTADDHWNTIDPKEPSEQDRQIDVLLASGYDFIEAYAEVYGEDEERLRLQESSSAVDRSSGESLESSLRRGYDAHVHEQLILAEQATRGHLLTKEAETQGIQAIDLFSGPTARARKWASEDLQRWWADGGNRMTFAQYKASTLRRSNDRESAEKTRLGSNGKDFI